MNSNCSNLLDMRNLQEQVKKEFCYQKLFWPFTVWTNCSSDLKNLANSQPSALNFKSFSWSIEQFFLTVGQNNFGNKIPMYCRDLYNWCKAQQQKAVNKTNHKTYPICIPSFLYPVAFVTYWLCYATIGHLISQGLFDVFKSTKKPTSCLY